METIKLNKWGKPVTNKGENWKGNRNGRPKYLKANDIDTWTFEVKISNSLDPTNTTFNFTAQGNISGVLHHIKSYTQHYFYNYFLNVISKQERIKFKYLAIHSSLFTAGNKRLITKASDCKSSLIDRGCLSLLSLPLPQQKEKLTELNVTQKELISKLTAKGLQELNELIKDGKIILED